MGLEGLWLRISKFAFVAMKIISITLVVIGCSSLPPLEDPRVVEDRFVSGFGMSLDYNPMKLDMGGYEQSNVRLGLVNPYFKIRFIPRTEFAASVTPDIYNPGAFLSCKVNFLNLEDKYFASIVGYGKATHFGLSHQECTGAGGNFGIQLRKGNFEMLPFIGGRYYRDNYHLYVNKIFQDVGATSLWHVGNVKVYIEGFDIPIGFTVGFTGSHTKRRIVKKRFLSSLIKRRKRVIVRESRTHFFATVGLTYRMPLRSPVENANKANGFKTVENMSVSGVLIPNINVGFVTAVKKSKEAK